MVCFPLPAESDVLRPPLSRRLSGGRLDLVLRDNPFRALCGTPYSVERDPIGRGREEAYDFVNSVSRSVEEKHFDADQLVELKPVFHQILRTIT